ncbi:MAG: M50 family metallopeptidase [Acutalibacteraceae bacterium]|nr:M50 family metallopeptidase [Acutalibacteraceae bacterium]
MKIITLMSAAAVWGKVWPVLVAILFFGLLIFFHELGHFTFAKLFKVKVNEFAMGMGPTLFKFKKGETRYALRLFPIGGFVSMEGEDEESENERAFCNKPAWQRFIIVAAGGVVNLIMGAIIVAVMLSQTNLIGLPQIHSFEENSVSSQYLQAGDEIKKINGKKVYSEYDLSFLMARDKDGIIDFTVEREGEKVELNGVPFQTMKNQDGTITIIYDFIIRGVEPGFLSVTKNAVLESVSIGRIVWISLLDLVTGQYGLSDLSGPIGTVSYIADAAQVATQQTDYTYLFTLMAMIAINIGLFNLLPLPALDGGRLFFLAIEFVFRKPVPAKYEGWVHAVGMVLLLLLMVVISLSDILRLIRG